MENKWRAVRYGLEGKLIDFGKEDRSADERELILEYLAFIDDCVDELGSRESSGLHPHDARQWHRAPHRQVREIQRDQAT